VIVCQIGHVKTGGFWWCPVENGADREIDDDLLLAACVRQDELQQKIDAECSTYATFLLCTPTSIMPETSEHGYCDNLSSLGASMRRKWL
jgi:hypothetical protein